MANLFYGLSKAENETIAMQVALFQSVTMQNLMMPYAQKAGRTAVSAIRKVAGLFNRDVPIDAPRVKEVRELIQENYRNLQGIPRNQLDEMLREELAKRSGTTDDIPDQELSARIIHEAAKNFSDIGKSLTASQMADAVAGRLHSRIQDKLNEELSNQTSREAARMERTIDEDIARMTPDERYEVQKALRVDDLTGQTIRRTLVSAGLPALVLTASGHGIFIATATIMHAVFTTMFGITLPFAAYTGAMSFLGVLTGPVGFGILAGVAAWQIVSGDRKIDREMLSQFIYLAFICNGHPFAPLENELAEWKSASEARNDVDRALNDYILSLEQNNNSVVSPEEVKAQLSALRQEMIRQNELAVNKVKAEFAKKSQGVSDEEWARIINERDEIIERQKIENERRYKELQERYEREISRQRDMIAAMRAKQDSLVAELEKNSRNKMLRNEEIHRQLHDAVNKAKHELDIISPWMNKNVVDDDFVRELRQAVIRGVVIKIRYGIGDGSSSNGNDDKRANKTERTAHFLRREFGYGNDKLRLTRGNEHSKLFICDDEYYVITSYNPLSFDGDYSEEGVRGEIGEVSTNRENLRQYRKKFFNF